MAIQALRILSLWIFAFSAQAGDARPELKNFDDLSRSLGFEAHHLNAGPPERLTRIAILDRGFVGYQRQLGKSLPANTQYIPPVLEDAESSQHGLFMAELLTAFMTNQGENPELAPELFLFPATSKFTNFQEAITKAIELKVDIILHSVVFDYGNNFMGDGFYNALVNTAIEAGVLWINAAGNFATTTYNIQPLETDEDKWLKLPGPNNSLPINCKPISELDQKTCAVRLSLSWNDFKEDIELGTDQDLDLLIYDDTLNILQSSQLKQVISLSGQEGESIYPREIIEIELEPGKYYLRVKNRSENFKAHSQARITGQGDGLSFALSHPRESLLNPADHPDALTVGASDIDKSSQSQILGKPEIKSPSIMVLSEGEMYAGTSNSAAIVAAAAALALQSGVSSDKETLLQHLTQPRQSTASSQASRCFSTSKLADHHQALVRIGAELVNTHHGLFLMIPMDPRRLRPDIERWHPGSRVISSPSGVVVKPSHYPLAPDELEVRRFFGGQNPCFDNRGVGFHFSRGL